MLKTVKPFIKWAGGKNQLLNIIRSKYPENIKKYCEPFVGGGAVLFDVLANFKPEEILINDINPELINTYIHIRDNTEDIINRLFDMQEIFWRMDNNKRKEYFYIQRDKFNEGIKNNINDVAMAVLFIFLNKTCFNGLYRVNSKGLYNVPIGSYKKPLICDSDNLRVISNLLQNIIIRCGDYSNCTDFIDSSTFVYIDPPYRPLNETSRFTSYSKTVFGDEQQIQLSKFTECMSEKGAKILASNSDPKNTDENDNFFDDIYRNFNITRVKASRMINSKGSGRGTLNELLISNF
ncbi:MAG: DNA adenine methylase [Ruminococcus sp.]|nr:DNA adenine methylase [Ruminococcus sp.]